MASRGDREENIFAAEGLVGIAAAVGAQVVLLQELFETDYFCQKRDSSYFALATELSENNAVKRMSAVAKKLSVVMPVSFFERSNGTFYNTVAMIDADGSILGTYRKSHIPDGAGYDEKFFFTPGDTGFRVWDTAYGRIGCGICWDQWFPEAARVMALMGAELLLYPSAIGSEPTDQSIDSRQHWQICMQGHAAANMTPVAAANRIGVERAGADSSIIFYGSSFIADECGGIAAQADTVSECVTTASFDLDELSLKRRAWGLFRDRRPDLYGRLLSRFLSNSISKSYMP
jgi:N-carbamoylputrescine amidase